MRIVLALCGAALVAGCSTAPPQSVEYQGALRCDYAQMDKIEHQAKVLRTELHWVNCPQAHETVKKS
jgi:hypothetical protein